MRLDVFLKISRLIPRRSLAQEFCDAGQVRVNDFPAKSSKEVKAGDRIEIRRRNRVTDIVITKLPDKKQLSKSAVDDLYSITKDDILHDDGS